MLRFYTMANGPSKQPGRIPPSARDRRRAWLVHAYTGTGAVLAFLAAWGVVHGYDRVALGTMFAATIVDGTDGVLARRARVKEVLPDVDGGRIDDIVDYMTFVLVPMLLLEASGGLYALTVIPVVAIVMLSSLYGFVAPDAKTDDHYFTGFPSYWNIVVFYLYLAGWSQLSNAGLLLVLAMFVFVPIRYVYPSRMPVLRPLTIALGIIWGVLLILMLWRMPDVPSVIFWMSLIFPAYYLALSLVLNHRRR